MNHTPTCRHEIASDLPAIRAVVQAAFQRPGEADLVDNLRRSGLLTVSAVAICDQRIVGHVGFSPITVNGSLKALALAPVAVSPDCQRQGIGSALIRWALEECRRLGHGVVIVLGNPAYYHRFGFATSTDFGVESLFPISPDKYMLLELTQGAASGFQGTVSYPPEFDDV